jgi:hypothetical protein
MYESNGVVLAGEARISLHEKITTKNAESTKMKQIRTLRVLRGCIKILAAKQDFAVKAVPILHG